MAGTGKKILIGCGLGCGGLVLLVIALVISSTLWVKGTMKGFDSAIEARQDIDDRFGGMREFTPQPNGAVPAARMELFLTVRDATMPAREQIAQAFGAMPMSEDAARELEAAPFAEKMGQVFGITKSAFGLVGALGEFYEARNSALLASEMGMGEYTYIYSAAYHTWLGHSPYEGPGANARPGRGRIDASDDIGAALAAETLPKVQDALRSMLRNQLAALDEAANDAWRQALADEIEALEDDRERTPWAGSVPPAIAASFEPYRDRLIATYNEATNPLELARNKKQGTWSVTID